MLALGDRYEYAQLIEGIEGIDGLGGIEGDASIPCRSYAMIDGPSRRGVLVN